MIYHIYEIVQVITSTVLVFCYLVTLIWVRNGSKYAFVTYLITMLLVSNISAIVIVFAD